jgi:hypothetical protein
MNRTRRSGTVGLRDARRSTRFAGLTFFRRHNSEV